MAVHIETGAMQAPTGYNTYTLDLMQALDGNSVDKNMFREVINSPIAQLKEEVGLEYLIGDSVLYVAKTLQDLQGTHWITRVPETLLDARESICSIAADLLETPEGLCLYRRSTKSTEYLPKKYLAIDIMEENIQKIAQYKTQGRPKKDQQKVERGFRFLKDPLFMASTLFLKSAQRIMALTMIMTLSLLVYTALELMDILIFYRYSYFTCK